MPGEHADKNGSIAASPPERVVIEEVVTDRTIEAPDPEREAYLSPEACEARRRDWDKTIADLAAITDETDTDEVWSEILANVGVRPVRRER